MTLFTQWNVSNLILMLTAKFSSLVAKIYLLFNDLKKKIVLIFTKSCVGMIIFNLFFSLSTFIGIVLHFTSNETLIEHLFLLRSNISTWIRITFNSSARVLYLHSAISCPHNLNHKTFRKSREEIIFSITISKKGKK